MSNFEGNVRKNANSFKPQTRAGDGAGVGRVIGGVYAGQDAPVVFEKADQPVLDTTPTPRTDGRGESELGLSGQVDHPNNDGSADWQWRLYIGTTIAREAKRLTADGSGLENLSREERRKLADELIQGVYDGDGQHPSGEAGSESQTNTLAYITAVANVLFGVADELPGTPTFLTRSEGAVMHKLENGVSRFVANPTTADLKKQLNDLVEKIRTIMAQRAGVVSSGSNGSRFVHKSTAEKELHKALANGRPVQFSGADPRTEAERASGTGRKFQPRA